MPGCTHVVTSAGAQSEVNVSATAPKLVSQLPSTMINAAGNSVAADQVSAVGSVTVISYQSVSRGPAAKAVPQNVSPQPIGVNAGFFGSTSGVYDMTDDRFFQPQVAAILFQDAHSKPSFRPSAL